MEKRKNLVNKFSSFLYLRDDNHQTKLSWKIDYELENNMKLKVERDPDAKEFFWAQYFLKVLLVKYQFNNQNRLNLNLGCSVILAQRHLLAYLQEACVKAAKDIHYEMKYIKHKYSLEEYFQMANVAASSPVKLFKKFNFERDNINIEAYAITAFKRFVRNEIYQQDLEARRTRFSNYGLLKDLSVGELNEALEAQNFSSNRIILYRLAWQCFYEIIQPISNRYRKIKPSEKDFGAIANYYNQQCKRLGIPNTTADHVAIKKMLLTCIYAARNYRNKQYLKFEEDYHILYDPAPSTWDVLIQQEEWQQVQIIVDNLFTNMPEMCQIIFKLLQGLNLTQTEVANILKSKYPELQRQYQVARHLKRYNRKILKQFAEQWNKIDSEVYLNDEKDIERIKSALEKCLQFYSRKELFSILNTIIEQFTDEEKKHIFSSIKLLNQLLEQQRSYDNKAQSNLVTATKLKLLELFQEQLEKNMCLSVNSLSLVNNKIVDFVNEWITIEQNNFYAGK